MPENEDTQPRVRLPKPPPVPQRRPRNSERVRDLAREAVRRTKHSNSMIDDLAKTGQRVVRKYGDDS